MNNFIKLKLNYLLVFLLIGSLFSCNNKQEVIDKKWSDGSPQIVKVYETKGKSKKLVKEIGYYKNKQKYVEGEVNDSIKEGKWTVWYEDGKIWSEGYFKNNKPEGKRTVYYQNGKIQKQEKN